VNAEALNAMTWIKEVAKRSLRQMGIDAHGYRPDASRDAQLKAALDHFGITHAFDIGANEGQFGLELFGSGYRGELVSVEPLQEVHAKLVLAASKQAGWKVHAPVAVGAAPGKMDFYVAANTYSSSALQVTSTSVQAAPQSRQTERREVAVTTVDALQQEYALPAGRSLLKVDTQGFEWSVLDGAGGCLQDFELVLLELSLTQLYVGQRLWLDVVQRMAAAGYGVWMMQSEFVDPATGRTLQANGLFYREQGLHEAADSGLPGS
jgi:FkbM family methyltransferase